MPNRVRMLTVPEPDRVKLERRVRDRGAEARVAERARIVLLAAEGLTGPQIAERVGCTEPTVIKWRRQYAEDGLAGLEDAPRPGGPSTALTDAAIAEILPAAVTPPPGAAGHGGFARRVPGPLELGRELAVVGVARDDDPARGLPGCQPPAGRERCCTTASMRSDSRRAMLPVGSSRGLKMVTSSPRALGLAMRPPRISWASSQLRPPGYR